MPNVLTDNNIWDVSVPAIADGDDLGQTALNAAPQALANRTTFLNAKIDETAAAINLDVATQVGQINSRVDNVVPYTHVPGQVLYYAGSVIPSGWLLCDGRAVSRADYADLFAALGTTWGAGNGTTTFNLPPLCGEFIRCLNPYGTGLDANRTLSATAQADDLKAHTHNFDKTTLIHQTDAVGTPDYDTPSGFAATATSSTGGTETRPHNIALNAIIKT